MEASSTPSAHKRPTDVPVDERKSQNPFSLVLQTEGRPATRRRGTRAGRQARERRPSPPPDDAKEAAHEPPPRDADASDPYNQSCSLRVRGPDGLNVAVFDLPRFFVTDVAYLAHNLYLFLQAVANGSQRPKRSRRPPQRYEPEERPTDDFPSDDYDSESGELSNSSYSDDERNTEESDPDFDEDEDDGSSESSSDDSLEDDADALVDGEYESVSSSESSSDDESSSDEEEPVEGYTLIALLAGKKMRGGVVVLDTPEAHAHGYAEMNRLKFELAAGKSKRRARFAIEELPVFRSEVGELWDSRYPPEPPAEAKDAPEVDVGVEVKVPET